MRAVITSTSATLPIVTLPRVLISTPSNSDRPSAGGREGHDVSDDRRDVCARARKRGGGGRAVERGSHHARGVAASGLSPDRAERAGIRGRGGRGRRPTGRHGCFGEGRERAALAAPGCRGRGATSPIRLSGLHGGAEPVLAVRDVSATGSRAATAAYVASDLPDAGMGHRRRAGSLHQRWPRTCRPAHERHQVPVPVALRSATATRACCRVPMALAVRRQVYLDVSPDAMPAT